MASFASTTFAHDKYAAYRPPYPVELYETILSYHDDHQRQQDAHTLAIDLGTGHGLVARSLSPYFARVHGIDPSPGMIVQARDLTSRAGIDNVSFHESPAESLPFFSDAQVELVACAEAAHWFDYDKFWPEMARVVRPGGTLAVWGYSSHHLISYPSATEILERFSEGRDEQSLGPYWPEPGHSILHGLLRAVAPPDQDWEYVTRLEYEPGSAGLGTGQGTRFMTGKMRLGGMGDYIRTWSSFHGWQRRWPDKKKRQEDGGSTSGDVVDEMMDRMLMSEPALKRQAEQKPWQDIEVDVEWRSVLILATRRSPCQ